MKVFNPSNQNHTLKLIPRFIPNGNIDISFTNEVSKEVLNIYNSYIISDGYLIISFDFDFKENDKFQFKISESGEIAYRGKLIATSQNPQDFKQSKGLYYYE